MKLRLIIIFVIFLLIFGLFIFSPSFNWGTTKHLSVYHEYLVNGDWLKFFEFAVAPAIFSLIALLFLFLGNK